MKSGGIRPAIPKITVRNLQRAVAVNVVDLEKFAAQAVRLCLQIHKDKSTDLIKLREVSILLVSDRRMALLHRQFLHEVGPTDVMTFQHGEIFISAQTARRHAGRFGTSLVCELSLYVVHGLLHLHGFDDRNEADARKMKKVQQEILEQAEL
jgi:probable rRNA maturation factor